MSRIPVALQLFSVRGECQNDVAATLKSIAEIGYVAAEPWGYRGDAVEWMGHGADELPNVRRCRSQMLRDAHCHPGASGRQPVTHG